MAINRYFKIEDLLGLVENRKYEITDAGFAAIDRLDQIVINKKMQKRKVAVQIMDAIVKKEVSYYYKEKVEPTQEELERMAEANLRASRAQVFSFNAETETDSEEE